MVSRCSCLPQCSTKSMFYMLFSISLYVILHVWTLQHILNGHSKKSENSAIILNSYRIESSSRSRKDKLIKYVLLWNDYYHIIDDKNESIYPSLKCSFDNCQFTTNRAMLGHYKNFDAIIFSEKILSSLDRPKKRKSTQLFVFTTKESPYNHAACELYNDNFFNWTFTYRLDSDVMWNNFMVRDASGAAVAPSADVEWDESISPLRPVVKSILRNKKKVAAWIANQCETDSIRDDYLMILQYHLSHFSLKIDFFGRCYNVNCTNKDCDSMLTQNYRFYIAFENSLAEDYVTEKVMLGYRNYAVPVVYGGANYTRFLPSGSYINAREMHPYNVAAAIYEATKKRSVLESYFKWTNLYSVHPIGDRFHPLCELCEALNDNVTPVPAITNFRVWWNTLDGMKWCLPPEHWREKAIVNIGERIYNEY